MMLWHAHRLRQIFSGVRTRAAVAVASKKCKQKRGLISLLFLNSLFKGRRTG